MNNQDIFVRQKIREWLLPFITPVNIPDNIIEQQQAKQQAFYLFVLTIGTAFNLILWILRGSLSLFTVLGFLVSLALYAAGRTLPYKIVTVITIILALIMPFILLIFSPADLTIVAVIFLLIIALFTSSQFLSLQTNLQISIVVIILVFVLNTVAVPDTNLSFTTILVPTMIIIFMNLLNAYGRDRLKETIHHNESPKNTEFYSHSIDLLPDAVLIELDKVIVAANNPAVRLIGLERDTLIGRTVNDFISTDSSTNYSIDREADNLTIRYEDDLITADTEITQVVHVTASSINYAGELATMLILRPKKADDTGTQNTSQDSEGIFRAVTSMMSDYAYTLDVDAPDNISIAWLSEDFQKISGVPHNELISSPGWTALIHQDDRASYASHLQTLLNGEASSVEYRILKPDASPIQVRDTAYPIYDEVNKRVSRIPGFVNDITYTVESQEISNNYIVQQAVVAELGLLALNTRDTEEIQKHVTILCEQVLDTGFVAIFKHDPEAARFTCVSLSRQDAPISTGTIIEDNYLKSLAGYTLHTEEVIICEDMNDEPRFSPLPEITKAQYGSCVGILIMGKNNAPYGVLTVYSTATYDFSYDEVYFLQSIANILGTFIERNRAELAEEEQAEFAEALRDANAAINSRLELPDVLTKIISYLQHVVPQAQQTSIMLRNEETGYYQHYITRGFSGEQNERNLELTYSVDDFPLLKEMVETHQPVNVNDTSIDERWLQRDTSHEIQSYLAAPIILDDEIIGFINLHSFTRAAFSKDDATRLKTFADTVSTAIVNAQKREDLERKVEQRTAELKAQGQQLSTILSATGDGIFYTENDYIAFVNEALCKLTGYSADELLNQSSELLQPDDILPQELDKLDTINDTIAKGDIWRDTVRLRRKDGITFDAGLTITRVSSSDENTRRTVTLVRDMSKERELEELKKVFIARAAHDLRSPITSIQMRMHMIKKRPDNMDYHMERLDTVVERMNLLVNDLLDAHGRIVLQRQNIILQDMLDLIVDILSVECELKDIQLNYESPAEPVMILADKHRLEQVFYNLINNAINYTDSGGEITIAYHLDRLARNIKIDIRDTGPGIPRDEQENIFLPFYRAKGNQKKGNGLGLSITREIVNLHDGDIKVQSQVGKGSTFTVVLPLMPIE